MGDKIVFSTDKGRIKEEKKSGKAYEKAEGPTKMRLEASRPSNIVVQADAVHLPRLQPMFSSKNVVAARNGPL